MGCHFLLRGIFLTQGSNLCFLHWQANSLPPSHHGSPMLCIGNFICLFCELNVLLFGYNYKLYGASLVAQMVKNLPANAGDAGSIPGLGRSPGGGHGNSLQYSCLENPHGQRSLVGYSPWGRTGSGMTENLRVPQHKLDEHYTNSSHFRFITEHFTVMFYSIKTQIMVAKIFYFKCQSFKQNFRYLSQQYQEWRNRHLKTSTLIT